MSYEEYEQELAASVIRAAPATMLPSLRALIDAFPYFGSPEWQTAHRGALQNLLETQLPNDAIAPHPPESGIGYNSRFYYDGPYSGYRDAFYHGIVQNAPAADVAAAVQSVDRALNAAWWGTQYGVAILTDAVRLAASIPLDSGKLVADLRQYNAQFRPALSASVMAVVRKGFAPTESAYGAIVRAGQTAQALGELSAAIAAGQFTANINVALSGGGDGTTAAVWFLYFLWMALKILGCPDVDAEIRAYQAQGLRVPADVGPGRWWNGGYTSWYAPLSGADVAGVARTVIKAEMPQKEIAVFSSSPTPITRRKPVPQGYSRSLCDWGTLARYRPPDSSCFGRGTGVRMADGSVKPIEEVVIGDEVQSAGGPKRVVLVESPPRRGRALYRLNDLDVFATAAHPFRAAGEAGPRRRAVDPWALIDSTPTMTREGVGALTAGVVLAGSEPVEIRQVTPLEAPAGDRVFDLILEGHYPPYFVGGPAAFLAADSETSDARFDPAVSLAIVTALRESLDAVRGADPRDVLAAVSLEEAMERAGLAPTDAVDRPPIPGPDFYLRDGAWDAHASALEAQLVRFFARRIRRALVTGMHVAGGHHALELYDLEVVGERPLPRQLRVSAGDRSLTLAIPGQQWRASIDRVLDLGPADPGALTVTVDSVGRVWLPAGEDAVPAEHFLFDDDGVITGRLALGRRRGGAEGSFTRRDRHDLAARLGRELARAMIDGFTSRTATVPARPCP